jgi:uncharacterized protein YfiM (DUF2279 family)
MSRRRGERAKLFDDFQLNHHAALLMLLAAGEKMSAARTVHPVRQRRHALMACQAVDEAIDALKRARESAVTL